MTNNGHTKPSQSPSDALCAACGLPANPDSDHVVVEVKKGGTLRDTVYPLYTAVVTMSFSIKEKNHD